MLARSDKYRSFVAPEVEFFQKIHLLGDSGPQTISTSILHFLPSDEGNLTVLVHFRIDYFNPLQPLQEHANGR